jgi:hypothetical protein
VLQALQVTGRHGRVELELLVLRLWRGQGLGRLGRTQGIAHAGALPIGLGSAFGGGQQLGQQLVRELGVAKKSLEELAEDGAVLLAADQRGLQCCGQVLWRSRSIKRAACCASAIRLASTGKPARRNARPKATRLPASRPVRASPRRMVSHLWQGPHRKPSRQ